MRLSIFGVAASLMVAVATHADETPAWAAFTVQQLQEQRAVKQRTYLEFLRTSTVRLGFYELAAGASDRQTPHTLDEVYYVVAGRAVLDVGGKQTPVAPGSIMFVKAGVDHRFVDIEEDLTVVVLFSTTAPE